MEGICSCYSLLRSRMLPSVVENLERKASTKDAVKKKN